jgi:pyrroloquinoline quinone biosynthesis protein B
LARVGQIPPQLQSCIAVSGDGKEWWLVNATPDLGRQIAGFPPLQPSEGTRTSPVAGVLLTDADIDHAIGILLMRERESPLAVYTSAEVREKLRWADELMQPFCGIDWRELPRQFVKLGDGVGLRGTELPRSVAFQLKANRNRLLVIAPAVNTITGELDDALQEADAIFFDGTFWNNDELVPYREDARSALEIGHMPVERSLGLLTESSARRKIYTHINNTNPILAPGSPQRRAVESAGITIGYDGLEFEL